ncbi:MAG TPA: S16 family serine protease [Gaiellaceae bacterium]|nr:S16 family serine protease [Gaiellaceae bacterium]
MRRWVTPGRVGALALLLLAVLAVAYVTPSDDYLFLPVNAQPLAPKVHVQGARPDHDGGGIYYDEVHIRKATILEKYLASTRPDGSTFVKAADYLPPHTSEKQQFAVDLQDMKRSQKIAAAVALKQAGVKGVKIIPRGVLISAVYLGTPAAKTLKPGDTVVEADGRPVRTPRQLADVILGHQPGTVVHLKVRRNGNVVPVAVKTVHDPQDAKRTIIGVGIEPAVTITLPLKISIDLGRVGGPSAGLAFALDILEELGRNVDHGLKVAATGEINLDGSVGPIGGIKQKTIGARRAGVDVFLVPAGENATEAKRYGGRMRIIPVESFRQALHALATVKKTA